MAFTCTKKQLTVALQYYGKHRLVTSTYMSWIQAHYLLDYWYTCNPNQNTPGVKKLQPRI